MSKLSSSRAIAGALLALPFLGAAPALAGSPVNFSRARASTAAIAPIPPIPAARSGSPWAKPVPAAKSRRSIRRLMAP
jgi:hypothetical protein